MHPWNVTPASVADGGNRLNLDQLVVVPEDGDPEQRARRVVFTETITNSDD